MARLRTENGFGEGVDDAYAALIGAHAGLDEEAGAALDARLVLILANHVGDLEVLREAIAAARATLTGSAGDGARGATPPAPRHPG